MEYCTDLILGEVFCIFILYFPDSELSVLNGLHFYSHWHDTENREYVVLLLKVCFTAHSAPGEERCMKALKTAV